MTEKTSRADASPGRADRPAPDTLLAGVAPLEPLGRPPRVEMINLLVLHQLQGVGRRKILEVAERAPFLLAAPRDSGFWGYLEKNLRTPIPSAERSRAQRTAEGLLAAAEKGLFRLVHLLADDYPMLLREIYDPPMVLFCRGDVSLLHGPCVAVVGARQGTDYGVSVAQELSLGLAGAGVVVVSGMALGVDSSAHTGALKARGRTVAVLGSGVDVPYPAQAGGIHRKICAEGCVVSEFLPGTRAAPQNFPIRNRIISGLSLGVVIVEATERSGSLITARLALEQGRELFAVPGSIHSPLSVGPNYLVKQGAKLVQIWQDVVEELPGVVKEKLDFRPCADLGETVRSGAAPEKDLKQTLTSEEKRVYNLLLFDRKVHLETLLEQAGLSAGALAGIVLKLQFEGLILELPGQYFIRNVRGRT